MSFNNLPQAVSRFKHTFTQHCPLIFWYLQNQSWPFTISPCQVKSTLELLGLISFHNAATSKHHPILFGAYALPLFDMESQVYTSSHVHKM